MSGRGAAVDATLSYNLSFILEGVAGVLNLMVLALLSFRQRTDVAQHFDGVFTETNRRLK